jgi:hypothetical protein
MRLVLPGFTVAWVNVAVVGWNQCCLRLVVPALSVAWISFSLIRCYLRSVLRVQCSQVLGLSEVSVATDLCCLRSVMPEVTVAWDKYGRDQWCLWSVLHEIYGAIDQSYLRSVSPEIKVAWDRRCLRYVWSEISAAWNHRWLSPEFIEVNVASDQFCLRSFLPEVSAVSSQCCLRSVLPEVSLPDTGDSLAQNFKSSVLHDIIVAWNKGCLISVLWVLTVVGASWSQDCPWSELPGSYNLVPFPALFLIYFSTFTVQYFTRFILAGVVLPALSKSSALGFLQKFFRGRGIEPGTAVQQSSVLSTKPRCTLCQTTLNRNKPRCTLGCIGSLKVVWMNSILISYYLV